MSHSRINVAHVLVLLVLSFAAVVDMVQAMVPPLASQSAASSVPTNSVLFEENSDLNSGKVMLPKKPVHTSIGEYPQCEWIPVTVCQGLGYNMTAMPNLIGHTNLLDAEIMVNAQKINFYTTAFFSIPLPRRCRLMLIPHCSVCVISWPDTSHTFLGHLSSLRRDDLQRLRIKRRIVCDLRLSRLVCFESGSGYKI